MTFDEENDEENDEEVRKREREREKTWPQHETKRKRGEKEGKCVF